MRYLLRDRSSGRVYPISQHKAAAQASSMRIVHKHGRNALRHVTTVLQLFPILPTASSLIP